MTSISVHEAQAKLADLLHQLSPGEELVITEGDHPLARIIRATEPKGPRKLGAMAGMVLHMSSDFDAPLDDFREYME